MALWTSDKYNASIKKLSLSQNRHSTIKVVLKPAIRTNMHICVPVLIPCPIPGLIWVLSSYISSAKGVILVYSRTNMYICVPVLILCPIIGLIWVLSSYISSAKGDILVYTQCAGGYIQREHPWCGYIPGEKPYQSEYGATDGWGGMSYSKVPLWHPLCSIWWRTKVKAYYSHVCVRT